MKAIAMNVRRAINGFTPISLSISVSERGALTAVGLLGWLRLTLGIALVVLLTGCHSVRIDSPRKASQAIDRAIETELGRNFARQLASGPHRSGIHLLVSGAEAFAVRAALAQHPNVEVRLFNPFSVRGLSSLARLLGVLGNPELLNRQMHNKL